MTRPSTPLVTIGLPVYNSERYLTTSLDSLLAQTFRDFVLIISDNASTDRTAEICRRYAAADPRVRYHRNETNIGNPRNFNRVFQLTETPYLKWSTSDDFWAPTFLEKALEVMEGDESVVLCYPQAAFVDADGQHPQDYEDVLHLVQDDPVERFLFLIDNIKKAHQHLGVIRSSALARTHMLGVHVSSDINLLAELTLYGKFYELSDRLFFRRVHKDSGSWKRNDPTLDADVHNARTYYASDRPRVRFPTWRARLAFFDAVRTSPVSPASKRRLYWELTRRMKWYWRTLQDELVDELRPHSTS
jgi:glycosyltransferase involved in cell wall biosynthesis